MAGVLAGVLAGAVAAVLAVALGAVLLAAGVVGVVAALLAGWAGLAGADVVPDAAWPAGLPARARPSAVPPAASRKARVSTTGSRAVRRRAGRAPVGPGAVGPGAVGPGAAPIGPGADGCQVWASTVWVGFSYRVPIPGSWVVVSAASTCAAVGRACESLARAASTSGRRPGGTALMSGSACMIRYMMASDGPVPNGAFPPAAKATVTAHVKMSAAVPARPVICSGAMKPAEPTVMPVLVRLVVSSAWAMPKSMTFGPAAVSSTLEGFRSRCTIPAAWIAASASASPVARPYSIWGSSGPYASTYSDSEGPSAYSVTRNGFGASVSASITRTVHMPWILVSAVTSRPNLVRNSGLSASSGRSTLTATGWPSRASAR